MMILSSLAALLPDVVASVVVSERMNTNTNIIKYRVNSLYECGFLSW